MKHISKNNIPALPKESCSSVNPTSVFHPLSYYLNGGIDLSGDEMRETTDIEYDSESDYNDLISEGASSVAFGDPRVSKFDLVERGGKYFDSKKSATSDSNVDTQSSSESSSDSK